MLQHLSIITSCIFLSCVREVFPATYVPGWMRKAVRMKKALITVLTSQDGSYLAEYLLEQDMKAMELFSKLRLRIQSIGFGELYIYRTGCRYILLLWKAMRVYTRFISMSVLMNATT